MHTLYRGAGRDNTRSKKSALLGHQAANRRLAEELTEALPHLTVLTTKYTSTAPLTTINTVRALWVIGLSPGLGLTARLPPNESSSPAFPPESSASSPVRGLLLLPPSEPRGPAASAGARPGGWAAVGPAGRGDWVRGPRPGGPGSGKALAACSSTPKGPPKPGSSSSSRKAEARRRLRQHLQCGAFIVPGPASHHAGASGPAALAPRGTMGAVENEEVTKSWTEAQPWQVVRAAAVAAAAARRTGSSYISAASDTTDALGC